MTATVRGCTVEPVDARGVVGLFAKPTSESPHPAVIAFGGSGGGLGPAEIWAPALAEHGYAVLSIAYFGARGLPADLESIDVDVVERAAQWLGARPEVSDAPFGVMGVSRGSELAFLAGIHVDAIGPIVALAPSGISWFALDAHGPANSPSWMVDGSPVPYPWPRSGFGELAGDGPIALRPLFEALLAERDAIGDAELAIERCRGPILLVSGEDDQMWPSTVFAERIVARLARVGSTVSCEHLHYPDAGHAFGLPVGTETPLVVAAHPLTGASYAFGGTAAGNAAAQADAWPRIVAFLDQHLGRGR